MSTIKVDTVTTLDGTGNITLSRPLTGLSGSGASLTALNATELTSGTIPIARIADDAVTLAKMADDAIGVAQLSATGTASNSTYLRGDNSWATAGSTSASDLTSGTLPMARLSGTLPALNGSALTALNATQLTSGTLPMARLSGTLPALNGSALTNLPATLMVSKVVEFGHDMGTTGTLAVTGVGFQPTCIIACTVSNSDGMASWAYIDDNGTDNCRYRLDSASVDQFSWEGRFYNLVFGAYQRSYADFTSFDSDGFTINRLRQGTSSGTVGCQALCLR